MTKTSTRAAAEGMPENQPPPPAFFDLEPLLCDTINMLDVLVGMMDSMD
jgi:hypothetical protein